MKFSKFYLKLLTLAIASVIVDGQTSSPKPTTDSTTILWSLSPCQSAFWIPSTSSEFAQNWITYQYEGNPLSQFGECIFTLESDPNTRIEMIIQEVHLFGNGVTTPPPCLNLYNVEADGTIVLLKTECSSMLSANVVESVSTLTDINLAVISTTIRYGSFQLQARAVPRNSSTPPKVSSTTSTPSTKRTTPMVTSSTSVSTKSTTKSTTSTSTTTENPPSKSTTKLTTQTTQSTSTENSPSKPTTKLTTQTTESTSTENPPSKPTTKLTTQTTQNTTSTTNSSSESTEKSLEFVTLSVRKIGQPRVIVKMVSELREKPQQ